MIASELGRIQTVLILLKESKRLLESLDDEDEDYLIMKMSSDFVNTIGPKKRTALHFAVEGDSLPCVWILVEEGKSDIEQADSNSKTPLMIACERGNLDIVKYLLSKQASMLDLKKQKKNALIRATMNGHIHIVSYLLKFGIHPDLSDSSGNTAVHYAAGYGWTHILKFLIE